MNPPFLDIKENEKVVKSLKKKYSMDNQCCYKFF